MHEAELHVFSDHVQNLGKSAMSTPEIKFTERWKEHLEHDTDTTQIIDGRTNPSTFHIVRGAQTNEIML